MILRLLCTFLAAGSERLRLSPKRFFDLGFVEALCRAAKRKRGCLWYFYRENAPSALGLLNPKRLINAL